MYNKHSLTQVASFASVKQEKMNERKTTPMLPLVWIMVLIHFQVGLSLYVIPKHALRELEASFRRWTSWMGADKLVGTYLPLRASP